MSDQDSKPFNVVRSDKSGNSLNEKRSFGDFECRESGLSLDSIGDKKLNKKDDKAIKKFEIKNEQKNSQNKQPIDYQIEYDKMNFKYVNEGFTVQSNYFIKKMASDKSAQEYACKYPLYKMIRSIVKKFLFNELEIIFFAYILEENDWKVNDEMLRKHAFYLKDFLNITEVQEPLDYKSVLLFLVLNAYAVKFYLNESSQLDIFKHHLESIVPNFKELFGHWSKKFAATSLKVNPKQLNKIFKKISKRPTENKKQQEDYNSLVDAIIQISPPYNNEKSEGGSSNQNGSKQVKTEESDSRPSNQIKQPNQNKQVQNNNNSNNNNNTNNINLSNNQALNSLQNQMQKSMFPQSLGFDMMDLPLEKKQSMNQFMDTMYNLSQKEGSQINNDLALIKQPSYQSDDGLEGMINKQVQQKNTNTNQNTNTNNMTNQDFTNFMMSGSQMQFPNMMFSQFQENGILSGLQSNLFLGQLNNNNNRINNNNNNNANGNTDIKIPKTNKIEVIKPAENQNDNVILSNKNEKEDEAEDEDMPQEAPKLQKIFSSSIYMNE